jgi:hypothetical protein
VGPVGKPDRSDTALISAKVPFGPFRSFETKFASPLHSTLCSKKLLIAETLNARSHYLEASMQNGGIQARDSDAIKQLLGY